MRLEAGDLLVSVNGEAFPTGKAAAEMLDKRLDQMIGQSTAPMTFTVGRAGATRTMSVKPVLTCA